MLGAIAGDIIGSVYERLGPKTKDFPLFNEWSRFTDDSVLTAAVAEHFLTGREFVDLFHEYYTEYPNVGYGGTYIRWAAGRHREPYNSWGNGSAMRVSPAGIVGSSLEEVRDFAKQSAEVTHNHPEGIRGAQAVAVAVYLARTGASKDEIKSHVEQEFGYDLSQTLSDIRPVYSFDVSCQGSVPQSIISFLEAENFEDAVRNAISLGGDTDTMACIAGAIAEPFFGGVPDEIKTRAVAILDDKLRGVVDEFYSRFGDRLKP